MGVLFRSSYLSLLPLILTWYLKGFFLFYWRTAHVLELKWTIAEEDISVFTAVTVLQS